MCTVSRRYGHSTRSFLLLECVPVSLGTAGGSSSPSLSLWPVDVVDGRQQLLTSLLVDVRAQTHVDQVSKLLHGVFLEVGWTGGGL